MSDDKKRDVLASFLKENIILVVDKSSASRRRLTKTLIDLGGSRQSIHSVAHCEEALAVIRDHKPKLVLSDFAINGGSGFDLFKEYRKVYPEEKKSTLILITSNISQSAVAKAAEEDVDSFIIKPYTVQSLEASLVKAVYNKLHPSDYIVAIDKGKALMFEGKYEEALEVFTSAVSLNKKPALALFYQGQAKYFMEMMDGASNDYKEGLTFNNIHYKCQIGLYELFMKQENYVEAYSIVRNIAKYFPSNPERLKEVVRLAMITKNYQDMDEYYNIFLELEERTPDVVNYVCSGYYIAGKVNMLNANPSKAIEIFDKIGVSCMGITKFLRAMIVVLATFGRHSDAKKLLARFSAGSFKSPDYAVATYLAESATMSNSDKMSKGLEIYNSGAKDYYVMTLFVEAMKKEGFGDKTQIYIDEMNKLWPERFNLNKNDSKAA